MFPWSRSRSEYGSSSNRSPLLDDSEYDQVATSDQQPDHISYPPLSGGANNPPAPTPASNEQNEGYEPQGELAVQDISFEYLHTILGSAYFASPRIRLNSLGTWFAIYLNRKLAYQDNLQWEIYTALMTRVSGRGLQIWNSMKHTYEGPSSFCVRSVLEMESIMRLENDREVLRRDSLQKEFDKRKSISSQDLQSHREQLESYKQYPSIRKVLRYYLDEFRAKPFDWEKRLICFGHLQLKKAENFPGRTVYAEPSFTFRSRPDWDLEKDVSGKVFSVDLKV